MKTPSLPPAFHHPIGITLLGLALLGIGCSAYRPDPGSIPEFPDEQRPPPAPVASDSDSWEQPG